MQTRRNLIQDVYVPEPSYRRAYSYKPQPAAYTPVRPRPTQPAQSYVAPTRPKPKRRLRKVAVLALLVIASIGLLKSGMFDAGEAELTKAVKSATADTVKAEPIKEIDAVAAESAITGIIQRYPGLQIGVSFIDLKTGQTTHWGVEEPFLAASTPKLLTACLFLHQVEAGQRSLDQKVGGASATSQLKLLIEKSDNAAWASFNSLLKGRTLDQYAKEIGLQSYSSAKNTTTHADISLLLEKLYNRKLLNDEHTKLLLSYMQNASESQYIPAAVPQGVTVYHKAGYLEDRAHDAAIIDDGKRPFVLVVFSKANDGSYDFGQGTRIMHDITNVLLSAYKEI